MEQKNESHLSRILTNPDVIRDPKSFFHVYQNPIRRFFLFLTGDETKTDELFQEFALKFLSGAFDSYAPGKGRFRDYLKTVLRNQFRKTFSQKQVLGSEVLEKAEVSDELADSELQAALREFDTHEGHDILRLVDEDLRAEEANGEHQYHSLLKFLLQSKQDSKRVAVTEVASFLSSVRGDTVSSDNAKKIKSRAVSSYTNKLISEIGNRIGSFEKADLRQAAEELGVLGYCGKAL